ncbi:hypothetical protein BKA67DRAFT_542601 [Truncatella angustata]|uniref:Uncharacterized protein n=1 Tax=Truncatella angustata TaxID=152316 RepID=A0A9P8REY5_9PEZI|nr:uncharacterized protein BKA67DRAFT_542601 [Truncatella angustata]KAH6640077.1 hypothetical protein BKA67DRAFT_542601 [Truncatella angustata]
MRLPLWIAVLTALCIGVACQTTATNGAAGSITTEVIIISIVNNVTVTATDTVTATKTVGGQAGTTGAAATSSPGGGNSTSSRGATGTGGIRPNATSTQLPVQAHAVPGSRGVGTFLSLVWLALAFVLLG